MVSSYVSIETCFETALTGYQVDARDLESFVVSCVNTDLLGATEYEVRTYPGYSSTGSWAADIHAFDDTVAVSVTTLASGGGRTGVTEYSRAFALCWQFEIDLGRRTTSEPVTTECGGPILRMASSNDPELVTVQEVQEYADSHEVDGNG